MPELGQHEAFLGDQPPEEGGDLLWWVLTTKLNWPLISLGLSFLICIKRQLRFLFVSMRQRKKEWYVCSVGMQITTGYYALVLGKN